MFDFVIDTEKGRTVQIPEVINKSYLSFCNTDCKIALIKVMPERGKSI